MAEKLQYSPADLYRIAKNQRRLLQIILCSLVLYVTLFTISNLTSDDESKTPVVLSTGQAIALGAAVLAIALGFIVLAVLWVLVLVWLLSALRTHMAMRIVALIGSFLPFISLIVLLVVSTRATAVLRAGGNTVGLLGVSRKTLSELKEHAISHVAA